MRHQRGISAESKERTPFVVLCRWLLSRSEGIARLELRFDEPDLLQSLQAEDVCIFAKICECLVQPE